MAIQGHGGVAAATFSTGELGESASTHGKTALRVNIALFLSTKVVGQAFVDVASIGGGR